ncbi:MAG TPA: motility protein MotB, partial [Rhodobiaceae bacterium]|nr:motility protein MotB [Rhodobiaceae bacterium]
MFGRRSEGQAVPRKPASAPASSPRQDAAPHAVSPTVPKAGQEKAASVKP